MTVNDWVWLGLAFAQVSGLAITLAALGFGYDCAVRERVGLIAVLERDHLVRWLALGMAVFAFGLCFSQANWIQKSAGVGLVIVLGWISWQSRRAR